MELAVCSGEFLIDRARRGCAPSTCAYYGKVLRWLSEYLETRGVRDVAAITPRLLEEYLEHLRERPLQQRAGRLSPVTLRKTALSLRTFFAWCAARQLVASDPSLTLPIPKSPQRLPKSLSAEQARKLLAAPMSHRDRAVISLMLDTGLRIGEVVALDLFDVDHEQGTILVRVAKGGRQRMVVFAESTREALRSWLRARDSDSPALFTALKGNRLTGSGLYKAIKAVAEGAGLGQSVSPHRLRHSFATLALNNGAGLQDVSRMLGHSDLATTAIYFHVSTEVLQEHHKLFSPLDGLKRRKV